MFVEKQCAPIESHKVYQIFRKHSGTAARRKPALSAFTDIPLMRDIQVFAFQDAGSVLCIWRLNSVFNIFAKKYLK
jgi:hypothetical protein